MMPGAVSRPIISMASRCVRVPEVTARSRRRAQAADPYIPCLMSCGVVAPGDAAWGVVARGTAVGVMWVRYAAGDAADRRISPDLMVMRVQWPSVI